MVKPKTDNDITIRDECLVCKTKKFHLQLSEMQEDKTEVDIFCSECGCYVDGFNLEDSEVTIENNIILIGIVIE